MDGIGIRLEMICEMMILEILHTTSVVRTYVLVLLVIRSGRNME